MEDSVVPSPKRKCPDNANILMTYSKNIPWFKLTELGITAMPVMGVIATKDTDFFGLVSVKRLPHSYYVDQISDFREITTAEKSDIYTKTRQKRREVTLSTDILHHPNVLKICCFICYDNVNVTAKNYGGEESHEFINGIVTEHCPLGSVEDYVKEKTYSQISDRTVFTWCLQLARTMAYFNDKYHLMHRDIRPANIFVFENGNFLKFGSFGYARVYSEIGNFTSKTENIEYFAPEMMGEMNIEKYDYLADVWSFGIFLYYVTHGRIPFEPKKRGIFKFRELLKELLSTEGEQKDEEMKELGQNNDTLHLNIREDLHPVFQKLIRRCLRYNPEDRPTFCKIVDYLKDTQFFLS